MHEIKSPPKTCEGIPQVQILTCKAASDAVVRKCRIKLNMYTMFGERFCKTAHIVTCTFEACVM